MNTAAPQTATSDRATTLTVDLGDRAYDILAGTA